MKEGSMLDSALHILEAEGKEMKFADLWAKVKEDLEISPEEENQRIGRFYTDLSLSGTFVVLGENTWDLRVRHTYDKVHIDAVDAAEEAEYNEYVRGDAGPIVEDEEQSDEESSDSRPRESAAELLGSQSDNY